MFTLGGRLLIEATSRCALKCPRCSRKFDKGRFPQRDLPLEFFEKRLPPSVASRFDGINLSGNYGDPIYHKNFIEILKHLKKSSAPLIITTNGSHKSRSFWREVARILDKKDLVIFSVDGLEDTNHLYRVNSNWESIMGGMSELAGNVTLEWKFIIFRHNEHQVEEARAFAKNLGFDRFMLVESSLFGERFAARNGIDPLEPTSRRNHAKKLEISSEEMAPKCQNISMHYISSLGIYFPCCWSGQSNLWGEEFKNYLCDFDLNQFSFEEVFESASMKELESRIKRFSEAPLVCRTKCRKTCGKDSSRRSSHYVSRIETLKKGEQSSYNT